jgi:thiol:disulfide interchange protein DsbC
LKRIFIVILSVLLIFSAWSMANSSSPEEMFKKSFPNRSFETISPTAIKGIYEVYTGNQLFYYAPDSAVLIYGNIVTKEGYSLTRESFLKKMAVKMSQLPLESALKIGGGKNVVVEFIDPDCFHCRESYKFFSQRKDVTIYAFFYPLSPASEKKIQHILCAAGQVKAYHEVMSGKLDNNAKLNVCTDKKADETLKLYKKLAAQIGLRSTPVFYFKGQVIDGFEAPVFEKLLKN